MSKEFEAWAWRRGQVDRALGLRLQDRIVVSSNPGLGKVVFLGFFLLLLLFFFPHSTLPMPVGT